MPSPGTSDGEGTGPTLEATKPIREECEMATILYGSHRIEVPAEAAQKFRLALERVSGEPTAEVVWDFDGNEISLLVSPSVACGVIESPDPAVYLG